jgi:hypothetical protein
MVQFRRDKSATDDVECGMPPGRFGSEADQEQMNQLLAERVGSEVYDQLWQPGNAMPLAKTVELALEL